ncbi:hypothetical protein MRX96_025881 [Rhipicephalus microplus]
MDPVTIVVFLSGFLGYHLVTVLVKSARLGGSAAQISCMDGAGHPVPWMACSQEPLNTDAVGPIVLKHEALQHRP